MDDLLEETQIEGSEKQHSNTSLTQLPLARIKKIMKSDKDVNLLSSEAVFLISCATEMFIEQAANEAFERSKRDKRKTILYKDLASTVRELDNLEFLSDIIPVMVPAKKALLEQKLNDVAQQDLKEEMTIESSEINAENIASDHEEERQVDIQ